MMKYFTHNQIRPFQQMSAPALFIAVMFFAGSSFAASEELAYVDSIHQWGAWGLDIEPAAGGIQPPKAQALNARNSKVSLRTNSISALSPTVPQPAVVASITPPTPRPTPSIPVVPPTPPTPTVPPVGGPADGLF